MRVLILDDEQYRHVKFKQNLIGHEVVSVETAKDCIDQLENHGPWDWCFLDHDLGGKVFVRSGKGTGYEVAEWLRDNNHKLPLHVIVHSLNPAGALNMCSIIPNSKHLPFAWDKIHA